jgi:hypothetical protein
VKPGEASSGVKAGHTISLANYQCVGWDLTEAMGAELRDARERGGVENERGVDQDDLAYLNPTVCNKSNGL